MTHENEDTDTLTRPRGRRKPQQTTKVRFFGEVILVTDDQDPDEEIERFVAAGRHKILEKADPVLAAEITARFIERNDPSFQKRPRRRK